MHRFDGLNPTDAREQIDHFRARLLGARDLQASLYRPDDDQTFAALVVEAGRRTGFQFDIEDIRSARQGGRQPAADRACFGLHLSVPPSNAWLPVSTHWKAGTLFVDW